VLPGTVLPATLKKHLCQPSGCFWRPSLDLPAPCRGPRAGRHAALPRKAVSRGSLSQGTDDSERALALCSRLSRRRSTYPISCHPHQSCDWEISTPTQACLTHRAPCWSAALGDTDPFLNPSDHLLFLTAKLPIPRHKGRRRRAHTVSIKNKMNKSQLLAPLSTHIALLGDVFPPSHGFCQQFGSS